MKRKIFSFTAAALPFFASAHPGHGDTEGYTIIHYFTEPQHLIVTGLLMITTIVLVKYIRRERQIK